MTQMRVSGVLYMRRLYLFSRYHMSYMTSACWSQSRPGVFYSTKLDGTVDAWDLSYKQKMPVLTVKVYIYET